MADPVLITQWQWVEVATSVTSAVLHEKAPGYLYFYTFRATGDTAPAPITEQKLPTEAVRIFEYIPIEIIRAQYSVDIYVLCYYPRNNYPNPGAVRVDLNLGAVSEGGGAPYLDYNQSFELKVKQGLIPGHSTIDKFGENPDIDTATTPEDIWEAGGSYTYDADGTEPIVSIISDNGADTEPITVTGLDGNGDEVVQTVTLTGTVRVALTTPLWRVYRMENDGTSDLAGTVYCYTGTGGVPALADTRAIIDNGNNQTLMSIYTIPNGKVGYLYRGEVGMSRANLTAFARGSYYSRRYGKIFKVKKRIAIVSTGDSNYDDKRSFQDVVPGLTDIRLTIESVSANDVGVFGTLDIMLIDEDLFPDSYLAAIGQPGY